MRLNWLLLIVFAVACSGPPPEHSEHNAVHGSKAVIEDALSNAEQTLSLDSARRASSPKTVAPVPRRFEGSYVRGGDSSIFRPCGETRYYVMRERGEAQIMLRERFYYTARFMGLPMYAVFYGYFRDDTLRGPAGPTDQPASTGRGEATPTVVQRFMLTKVDSLRAYMPTDCRGKHAAR
jgi:hypothetical protein